MGPFRTCCAAILVAAGLAACGAEDYPKDPQKVARAYTSTNHAVKCRFLTQALMESLTGKRGAAAREACRRNVTRFAAPKTVKVKDSEADRHDAEVEVLTDGSEAKLKLVKEGEQWRIASFAE